MPIASLVTLGLTVCASAHADGPNEACRNVRWTLAGARSTAPPIDTSWPARLVLDEVYRGVSLTVESRENGFTYRFDVAPGGDAGAIRMRYEGAEEGVAEDAGTSLRIRAGRHTLRERGLHCFQDSPRRDVACSYHVRRVRDHAVDVTLVVGRYDPARALVIDPAIDWSSSLPRGGNGVAVDGTGCVYATGNGAFLSKIDGTGSLEWTSYLGGSDGMGLGVAVDASGNAYATGWTRSSDFPFSGGFDSTLGGVLDAFVAKVDASGALVWASYLGGSGDDYGFRQGIAVDAVGNVYVTGGTSSSDFPSTGGFDSTLGGTGDAFVTKVDAAGSSLAWSSFLGGSGYDEGNDVVTDGTGNAYVSGVTTSPDFPSGGGFDMSLGGTDAFVAKIDATGSLTWSSFLGGSAQEQVGDVAVDGSGNVFVTGWTDSYDFPSGGGFDTNLDGRDAFLTKVNAAGASLAWSSYLGGWASVEYGWGVAVDGVGNVYLTGTTNSPDFPVDGGFDDSWNGDDDAFVTKVNASGSSVVWSSYLGGSGREWGLSIATGDAGRVYVTGFTDSADFPGLGGATGYGFVTRIDACATCGDGCCAAAEDCAACPDDCGGCPEPTPDLDTGDGSVDAGGGGSGACSCSLGAAPPRSWAMECAITVAIAILRRRRR